jgi:hypothetical protein
MCSRHGQKIPPPCARGRSNHKSDHVNCSQSLFQVDWEINFDYAGTGTTLAVVGSEADFIDTAVAIENEFREPSCLRQLAARYGSFGSLGVERR